jgi:hypothetical protein
MDRARVPEFVGAGGPGRTRPRGHIDFALTFGKPRDVPLYDPKFDQDRSLAPAELHLALNQVRVLDDNRFWEAGVVGSDIKAIRPLSAESATKRLRKPLQMSLRLIKLRCVLDRAPPVS